MKLVHLVLIASLAALVCVAVVRTTLPTTTSFNGPVPQPPLPGDPRA